MPGSALPQEPHPAERPPVTLPRGRARAGPAGRPESERAGAGPRRDGARLLPVPAGRPRRPVRPQRFLLYVAVATLCLAVLLLPLGGQPSRPLLPAAFQVTLPQKLVAAYVLGLLTVAFLQG